ncbi:MAG TPA: amidohydrolase family protein [Chloroflexota bacterium]|jgi:aminocarboxymuconate-semialdehyde decarboxylase
MRIDVHGHYLPPEYISLVSRARNSTAQDPAIQQQGTIDERIGMLDESGVDLQVLSLGSNVPYLNEEQDAVAAARVGNDAYAAIAREHNGRLGAFGSVPLPHVDAAIAEASRCLDQLGMLGITLGCSIGERTLDDAEFEPFWMELNRRKAVVFLHPIFRATDAHIRDYELARMVGAAFEDTLAAMRLLLSGVVDRYPAVRIIVPHFGGTLPVVYPRIARRGKAELLRKLYYDTANGYGPALRCACEALGPERLMLGTDFPYIGSIKQNVDYVLESGLSPDVEKQILERTAADLLGVSAGHAP